MKLDEPIYWNDHVDKEHALEMVYTKMYITKVNKAMYEHYGAKFGDLDKLTPEIFFAWDEDFGRQFTRSLLEQGTATFENHEPRADGEFMWIEGNYVVLYDDQGRVRGSCGVRRDVTLRKQAEQEIQNHNKELKKANEELDNFVYRVSHDLKAPISSAKGLIYIAKQEQHKEDIVQCLDLIGKSMNKLDSFILDILDYSRNSRSKIEATEVDLKALLSELMESTRYLQEEKNLDTKVCIGGAALFTDRRRLTFIFNNLISNAIRFSDSEKAERYLHITADITPTKATILFADNGIGIHPEHIDHIFEMFYRASETLVGSGLGLYIVKEAVEKLNGNIKVTSAPGIGTSFELTIPNFIEDESCDLQNIQHLN
ncbi:MAG: PAS domain S-box protein [Cyclobacteriaceae bacterium]|nr:PAS domain S-box protein [Cyclobacteriaceae bacterium]